MKRQTNQLALLIALAAVILWPHRAAAHDLKVKVILEGDPVRVEAWFEGDIPAEHARATLLNGAGETIQSGTTDERGVWSFPRPEPGIYRVLVEQAGHRDVVKFAIPGGASEPESNPGAAPSVATNPRPNEFLGLIIGLALLLGGVGAFIWVRRLKRAAPPD